jgi:hypothetical protein
MHEKFLSLIAHQGVGDLFAAQCNGFPATAKAMNSPAGNGTAATGSNCLIGEFLPIVAARHQAFPSIQFCEFIRW